MTFMLAAVDVAKLVCANPSYNTMREVPSITEAVDYINNLDLSYITKKMTANDYSLPRWLQEEADICCQHYKNFLILQVKYQTETIVPTREIDEFWHNHILYTKQYTEDCLRIFGHYLHHEPADSTSVDELLALKNYFEITKKLYLQEFGEPLTILHR